MQNNLSIFSVLITKNYFENLFNFFTLSFCRCSFALLFRSSFYGTPSLIVQVKTSDVQNSPENVGKVINGTVKVPNLVDVFK